MPELAILLTRFGEIIPDGRPAGVTVCRAHEYAAFFNAADPPVLVVALALLPFLKWFKCIRPRTIYLGKPPCAGSLERIRK